MRPEEVVRKVLDLRQACINEYNYGPFRVYIPKSINLEEIYIIGKPSTFTLKDRILQIDHIRDVQYHDGSNIEVVKI